MAGNVAAIVLAAGRSLRMGCCKQLLPIGEEPAIVGVVTAIRAAGVSDIIVVTGHFREEVESALAGQPVTFARNIDVDSDMSQSVRVGMTTVPGDATGVLVCLADTPLVSPATYRRLMEEHGRCPGAILSPVHEGRKGHPNLFPLSILQDLHHHATLRDVVQAHRHLVRLVEVADRGVLEDMDTPADYRRLVTSRLRS